MNLKATKTYCFDGIIRFFLKMHVFQLQYTLNTKYTYNSFVERLWTSNENFYKINWVTFFTSAKHET